MINHKHSLVFITLALGQAQAQGPEIIPDSILPVIKYMSPLTKSAEYIALANNAPIAECTPLEPPEVKKSLHNFFPLKKDNSDWSVSIMTSMTAPPDTYKKEYYETTSPLLRNEMRSLMTKNFSSHDQRLKSISQMCNGKSEMDKIHMASYLGSQLSNIYDYDRADGKSSSKVSPEDQWNAINQKMNGNSSASSGVCRDATFTLTQFMVACGFSKDQLGIQSFRVLDGGHQIVTIRDSKGKLYTINWSELYSIPEDGKTAAQPHSNNNFTALDFNTYDADGKLVAHNKTELGNIIKAVTGGTVDDPNFQPNLLRLEAQFRNFNANIFQTQTAYGETASGVAASYKLNKNPDDTYILSMGVAYIKNEKDTQLNRTGAIESIDQTILYFQSESGVQKDFDIIKDDKKKISVKPFAISSVEIYKIDSKSSTNPGKFSNANGVVTGKVGGVLSYEDKNYAAWLQAQTKIIAARTGNTEINEGAIPLAIYGNSLEAGISKKGERYVTSLEAQTDISHYENRYSLSTSVFDKKTNSNASILYSVYDRGYGKRDDYVLVEGEKFFSFKKVGTVSVGLNAQVPLDGVYDPTVMATLKVKHK